METSKQHLCYMHRSHRRRRVIVTAVLISILTGLSALALYVVYRPMKPQASLVQAAVYQLVNAGGGGNNNNSTASSPAPSAIAACVQLMPLLHNLAACVQLMLLLHNPSDHAALLYDGLLAYAE
jgi:hypothetical protein